MCIQQWKWWQVGTHLRQTTSLKSGRRGQAARPKPPVRAFQSETRNLATRHIILTRPHFGTMLVSLLNATVSLTNLMLRHSGPWFNIKLSSYQKTFTFLPAWGYDPLQPGDPRGSQWGVRTAFKTKDNNRFHCLKSGPLKGPAWLGTTSHNGKSQWGDKMILRPSYLHNGIPYTGKTTFFLLNQAPGPYVHL